MERNEDIWREYIVTIDCPVCEAKTGEHCFVKPGVHLLGNDGLAAGFHGKRLLDVIRLDVIRLDGIGATLVAADKSEAL